MKAEAWLDRFFDSYYRHRPVNATFIGVHDYDNRLPDYSEDGIADVVGEMQSLLNDLDDVDREGAPEPTAIDLRLAEGYLRVQLWEFGSGHFQNGNPSHYVGEAVFGPMSLFLREGTPIGDRMESARARFEAVPGLLDQAKSTIERAPRFWIEKAIDECAGGINFAREGVGMYLAANGIEQAGLVQAADGAALAFEDYRRYLESEMLPSAMDDGYGCGAEELDLCIRSGHFLDMSPAEIAAYGRQAMDEARERLLTGAQELGFESWQEALAQLADRHPSAEDYLDAYGETWLAARSHAVEQDLVSWPDFPIRFVERPAWARSASPHLYFLFYRAPSAFDPINVYDYLVEPLPDGDPTPVLRAHNSSVIKLNHVVHHGGIGHHVQNWHAYRAASRIGRIAAVDCASRIAMLCGGTMAEGWSCYTTDLMDEYGFCTPLESLSQHQSRLRMAARAVADAELHAGDMTIGDAVALYRDEAGMTPGAARSEAVKNSMNPGAALMYLIGTDEIHRLRRDLVTGRAGMTIRDFHDQFLSYGSIPVSIISESMRAMNQKSA
ncbi:MAG: DUF885 domain-containing protein [Thermomicrobiales bacterium]